MSEEKEVKQEGDFKIKKKPKKLVKTNETAKIDMSKKAEEKPVENKIDLAKTEEPKVEKPIEEIKEEVKEEVKVEKTEEPKKELPPLEELTVQQDAKVEKVEKEIKEAKRDEKVLGKPLPENIEKLVSFMDETGGTVEDYVRINADYSNVDDSTLLREYYKNTKPHLNQEEINFIMEDNFSFDEEVDEERDIKKKKLAYKEEIAEARNFLEDMKDKYYAEIKNKPNTTNEQQKAMDFFNRYNEDLAQAEKASTSFNNRTNSFFTDEFKGFEFNVGDKRYNYRVNDVDTTLNKQSNINNFLDDFIEEGEIKDLKKYHKALYAARNADTIASHFYEQGKADATKDIMSKSNNVNNEPRKVSNGEVFVNGWKVKAISGINSSKLKIKK
jgi:hypothetical protein